MTVEVATTRARAMRASADRIEPVGIPPLSVKYSGGNGVCVRVLAAAIPRVGVGSADCPRQLIRRPSPRRVRARPSLPRRQTVVERLQHQVHCRLAIHSQ